MKMRDVYKSQLLKISSSAEACDFIVKYVLPFYNKKCDYNADCKVCTMIFNLWLDEEYTEPELSFECDELVEVSHGGYIWHKKHYARRKDGKHYCWSEGKTSKTATDEYDVEDWKYIRKCEV